MCVQEKSLIKMYEVLKKSLIKICRNLQSRYFFRAIPLLVSLFFVTLPKDFKKAAI